MRALSIVTALAASALTLTGCSGTGTSTTTQPTQPASVTDDAAQSSAPGEGSVSTSSPVDDAASTGAPESADTAAATASPGEAQGGAEGQAAADIAKKFFSAMVTADPVACDYLLSFTDVEVPMIEIASDYKTCQTLLPPILEEEVKAQGLDAEGAAILEAMQIRGADVQSDGRTAVVDKDNFSPLFAESMGTEVITLKKLGDTWYIDLDNSFTPTSGR